ncbi:tRNA glutamyl-Q(34) synthetase GluQRS [Aliiglaciecola sp. 3_MG-2023]|uniref:tRNA glutamyl-Q(34) synthetase GluQRS n=1 Tax=Aliiglaciecola sp. 3_MG-2023 TaxID=3062644 RepID=UPI0026E34DCF|nr:tRNA glutamyl-Q(34) synthetase GluQRS [Aliiglaciecola sp. 3_MG-2023]MDO6692378.1 tRNA glutamyl-Q(34) synthetase GluQRS [Aliiglaciecola sp. 3_MG-2023]
MNQTSYVGRFAPSPSGPLHMGSLVTALGSFLQAKVNNGKWLLRIDDIDPPRIQAGAIENIQATLIAHGLLWDSDAIFQSQNKLNYDTILSQLHSQNLLYPCECTRGQIKAKGEFYTGTCRDKAQVKPPFSLRIKNQFEISQINDRRLGTLKVNNQATQEDFIVKRKDGLYAYHLASVADDIQMGITEIVRGEDLITATACQWALFKTLGKPVPGCLHLPLVTFSDGRKFSKQNHAPSLDLDRPAKNLTEALAYLNLTLPKALQSNQQVDKILAWATQAWADSLS